MSEALIAVDLFAGAGGMACALRRHGFTSHHVEIDPEACATLRAAGFVDVVQADVAALLAWDPGREVALLHGSPPCPKWSTATHPDRRGNHPDGWPWMLAAVRRLEPWTVTVEITKQAPVAEWARDLEALGYRVVSALVNAAAYGAPQTRWRWALVASLRRAPVLPPPTHGEGLLPPATLASCLEPVGDRVVYPVGQGRAASEPWRLQIPAPTVTTTEVKGTRASESTQWSFNGGPDRASDATFLASGLRRITTTEAARLQGFPEKYPFQGTITAHYRQIGNAVQACMGDLLCKAALGAL